jgi:hypothetical protein
VTWRRTVRVGIVLLVGGAVIASVSGCGNDDDGAGTVSVEDWVHQFDTVCTALAARLDELGPAMTEAEFAAFTVGSVTTLSALPPPAEHADVAAGLLDDIEASQQPDLEQTAIDELDIRILDAMTTLGVSDTCIGGAPS